MPNSDVASLVEDMDTLARDTWAKVLDGPRLGVPFGEEGITDHNLFSLRGTHPELKLQKFTHAKEETNGADWEWWIGSDESGWVAIRIQAKKLSDGRYYELPRKARRQNRSQCQVLIDGVGEDADGQAMFAYYCFYNGWDGEWPAGVPWDSWVP